MTDLTLTPPPILSGTMTAWTANNQMLSYLDGNRWAYSIKQQTPNYNITGLLEIDDFETATPSVTYLANRAQLGFKDIRSIVGLTGSRFVTSTFSGELELYEYDAGVIVSKATLNLNLSTSNSINFLMHPISSTEFVVANCRQGTNSQYFLQIRIVEYDVMAETLSVLAQSNGSGAGQNTSGNRIVGHSLFPGGMILTGSRRSQALATSAIIDFSNLSTITTSSSAPVGTNQTRFLLAKDINNIVSINILDSWRESSTGLTGTFGADTGVIQGKSFNQTEYATNLDDDYYFIAAESGANCRIIKWIENPTQLATTFATLPGTGVPLSTNLSGFTAMSSSNGMRLIRYPGTDIFYSLSYRNATKEWNIRKFKP